MAERRRLRVLTWHVHGNYLYNLTQVPHDFYILTDSASAGPCGSRSADLPWGDNVYEAPLGQLASMRFDVVLYPSRAAWEDEQHRILTPAQRALPRIVLEHDPPDGDPTNTRHWCQDAGTLLVHVTPFNALMWDNGVTPTRIIEHGVRPLAEVPWNGARPRGLVVADHLQRRGRRLGLDVFNEVAASVPLMLVGMASEEIGGAGEVPQRMLPCLLSAHRFFFSPSRHTSLGLPVVEAMLAGVPVVGLATTELVTVIASGHNGFVDTSPARLVEVMRQLLGDHRLAASWGREGQRTARERFGIGRFVDDWLAAFAAVTA